MKTILIILSITIFCNAQSDSLKQNTKISATCFGITVMSLGITVIQTSKTAIIAGKEVYHSELVQNGLDSGKKGTKKAYHIVMSYIDSVKK